MARKAQDSSKVMEKYIQRSREGAQRAADDPELLRLLDKPDTGERLTREEFARRFGV